MNADADLLDVAARGRWEALRIRRHESVVWEDLPGAIKDSMRESAFHHLEALKAAGYVVKRVEESGSTP